MENYRNAVMFGVIIFAVSCLSNYSFVKIINSASQAEKPDLVFMIGGGVYL